MSPDVRVDLDFIPSILHSVPSRRPQSEGNSTPAPDKLENTADITREDSLHRADTPNPADIPPAASGDPPVPKEDASVDQATEGDDSKVTRVPV